MASCQRNAILAACLCVCPNSDRSVLHELRRIGEQVQQAAEYAGAQCEVIDDSQYEGTPAEKLPQFLRECLFDGWTCERVDRLVISQHDNDCYPCAGASTEKYFVATQDAELRHELRSVAGVPLLHLNKVSRDCETAIELASNVFVLTHCDWLGSWAAGCPRFRASLPSVPKPSQQGTAGLCSIDHDTCSWRTVG